MKSVFSLVLILALCLPVVGAECASSVSVIQLIATPERFDGKQVVVIGYLKLGEWPSLALHEVDVTHSILANTIDIDPTSEMMAHHASLTGKYVEVVGIFRMGPRHGRITSIKNCKVWSDPAHPFSEVHPVE